MPEVGRFVSEDPVAGWVPNPLTLNLYLFNLNNPFKYKDPDGLTPKVSNPTTKAVNNASGGCSATGLGDATTSPWLNDPRTGVRLHLEEFRNGGSFVTSMNTYNRVINGKKFIGYPDNSIYVLRKDYMDRIINEADGDLSYLEDKLGFDPGYFSDGGGLVRVDFKNPLFHNIRMPSGMEMGANKHFRWGGYTSGGSPEAVINQVPNTDEFKTITFLDW